MTVERRKGDRRKAGALDDAGVRDFIEAAALQGSAVYVRTWDASAVAEVIKAAQMIGDAWLKARAKR